MRQVHAQQALPHEPLDQPHVIKSRRLHHKLFWDVKLKRIDPPTIKQVDMQLDLVAEIGDRFYVFETKSGAVLSIGKWVDRSRLFDDDKHRFITCAANEALDPRIFQSFRLFALPSLERQFTEMLEDDFRDSAGSSASASAGASASGPPVTSSPQPSA